MAEKKYKMKATNIKGKKYIEVHERLKYFRLHYPDHDMNSEVFYFDGKECVITYKITSGVNNGEDYRIHAAGHAHEKLSLKGVNSTSFLENCDTSAIGRCLANFGIGIDEGYASADEMRAALDGPDGGGGEGGGEDGGEDPSETPKMDISKISLGQPYRGPKRAAAASTTPADPFL